MKDYVKWHQLKRQLSNSRLPIKFRERDIWWTHLGENIGNEEDGKGVSFFRPVIVVKKYNQYQLLIVPLSTNTDANKYRYNFTFKTKQESALLSQIRVIGSERLGNRMGRLPKRKFGKLRDALLKTI